MKSISEFINESKPYSIDYTHRTMPTQGNFKEKVKYSKSDWDKWIKLMEKEEWGKDILIGNYESSPELTVVYRVNNKNHTMDHIASFDNNKEILYCDDINIFGNYQ